MAAMAFAPAQRGESAAPEAAASTNEVSAPPVPAVPAPPVVVPVAPVSPAVVVPVSPVEHPSESPAAPAVAASPEPEPVPPVIHPIQLPPDRQRELAEERERQQALAMLKAQRDRRLKEEAAATARENERMELARELATCFYREDFAAFAGCVDRVLGRGENSRLLTLCRLLHQRRTDADAVCAAAAEFTGEAGALAGRLAAADGTEGAAVVPAKIRAACRAAADGDPASPETQRAVLALMGLFAEKEEGHGKSL